jgi:pentose-5-phosphate-3-epimerase
MTKPLPLLSVSVLSQTNPLAAAQHAISYTCVHNIHVDVMDHQYVPYDGVAITLCQELVKYNIPFEVHLMTYRPWDWLPYCAGAQRIWIHPETLLSTYKLPHTIPLGWVINPIKKWSTYYSHYAWLKPNDAILCMGVWPGKGGQFMLHDTPKRLEELRKCIQPVWMALDGGVTLQHAQIALNLQQLIVGSAFFKNPNRWQSWYQLYLEPVPIKRCDIR